MTPRRSLILDLVVRVVFDAALVLAVYMLFAGHNQPGGGFVGGLVAAAAIALRYIAFGVNPVDTMAGRVRPWTFLSSGLLLAVLTAIVPLLFGDAPLDQRAITFEPPILGSIKATTASIFDTGVFFIVVGLVLMIFEGLGDEVAPDEGDLP